MRSSRTALVWNEVDLNGGINMSEEFEDHLGLTAEQWAIFQKATHGFGEQDENGVDLSHLRANLRLTPTQRLEKHQQALARMQEVRRAGIAAGLYRRAESVKRA